jgi:alpha-1,2-mannosyltransferase
MAGAEPVVRTSRFAAAQPDQAGWPGRWLLPIGVAALLLSLAAYAADVHTYSVHQLLPMLDLQVYRDGGLLTLHHDAGLHPPTDLYSWQLNPGMQFTYTPFAAVLFATVALLPFSVLRWVIWIASVSAMAGAIWLTFGGLGYPRDRARLGLTLLLTAVLLWIQPVARTLHLGQVNLLLMALIIWDLGQPGKRTWIGAGVGIAAGVKLVPLIFIPYLALTGRLRQAAVATASFAATIAIGFAVLPRASARWWFHGLFLDAGRTGFIGDVENQSLRGMITRLSGSVAAGVPAWEIAAAVVLVLGLASATVLHRSGKPVEGLLTCALTGLLVSPISWDHHWVWVVPGLAVLVHYAARSRGARRLAVWAGAAAVLVVFGAWPSFWVPHAGLIPNGLIWYAPATFFSIGDHPWFREYHWHGLQLLAGNLYVLAGLACLAAIAVVALRGSAGALAGWAGAGRWRRSPRSTQA